MAHAFAKAGFQTRTITRNPERDAAKALTDAGVEVCAGDLADAASLSTAHEGVDVVALVVPFFVPPPNSPMTYMQNAVDAAKNAGVELLLWNTSGPMSEQRMGNALMDSRHDLYAILEASGIPHIVLAPGSYMENLMGPWTVGGIRDNDELAYPIPDSKRLSWITTNDVAALMVEAAKHPELADSVIRISGPENLTGPDMAQRFSKALGRDIRWRQLTPRQFGDQIAAVMGPEAGDALANDYGFINEHMDEIMAYHDMAPVLEKLPVQLTPLEDWVRQHAFAFQKR